MASGIYYITNVKNGKKYIGSSCNISERWRRHKQLLNNKKHDNSHLQAAWEKYAEESFKFEVAEECPAWQLPNVEQQYLNLAKVIPDQYYNMLYNTTAPTLGFKHSDKTKEKLSEMNKGKKYSDETKDKISQHNKANWENPEYRANITQHNKANWENPEYRANITQHVKARWDNPEYRAKMTAMAKGNKSRTGKPNSPESIAKGLETKRLNKLKKEAQALELVKATTIYPTPHIGTHVGGFLGLIIPSATCNIEYQQQF